MKKKYSIILFICILSGILSSAPLKDETEKLNLLFITLDTTRADCIGIYGSRENLTPNLDQLGQNGVVFRNCYAPVPLTLPSHCSIFTGRYPIAHHVRNNGTYYLNKNELTLAEVLKARGYQTAAIISSYTLLSKFGLNQGFDTYNESFDSQKMALNFAAEIPASKVYEKFNTWLQRYSGHKFFLWIHFYDPHFPYLPHPEVNKRFDNSNRMKYYGEIAFTDIYVGKIIEDLREKGLLENTLVVIAGDHGEAFGEHKEYGHGIFCYEESIKVPLIFYNSRLFKQGRFIDRRVSLVDILPTLLEIYDFDASAAIQGISLNSLIRGKKDKAKRLIYFESMEGKEKNNWAPLTGIIENNSKYISLLEPELYDLENDPAENINLYSKEPSEVQNLDKKLMQFMSDYSGQMKSSRRNLSPTDLQKLKSLGYVSPFSPKSNKMIDPKRGIVLYSRIEDIKENIEKGRFDQAERELNKLLLENPEVQLPNFFQASYKIKEKTGRKEEALAVLEKGIEIFPDNEEFKIQLALSFFERKEWEKAQNLCLELLEYDPLFTSANLLLGDINEATGKIREAILEYEAVLKTEPQNELAKAKYAYLLIKDNRLQRAKLMISELEEEKDGTKNPAHIEIMGKIGILLAEKNELESALSLLTKVAEISSSAPEAWINLGTVFLKYGQLDKAFASYQKALEIDPELAIAYSNLGILHLTRFMESNESNQRDKALENFDKAIRLDPDIAEAYNGRGAVYFSLNRIDIAIIDYKKSIELKPDYFDAYLNISYALFQLGQKNEALEYLTSYKEKYYHQLYPDDQRVLDRIISELRQN